MYQSWKIQIRVLFALTIREIQSQNSGLEFGYVWTLVDVCISIAAITLLKVFIRALSPAGMPPVLFLVSGIVPWITFHSTVNAVESVVAKSKRLLLLPNVTPLDLIVAKSLQIFCTNASVFLGFAVACTYFEQAGLPRNMSGVILLYAYSCLLGIAYGLVTMPLMRVFPPAGKILSLVWRFGLLFSGVFFVITMFPEWSWPYLDWNPMLHVAELMRTYWFSTYQTPVGSVLYILECLGGLGLLGLSLERYVRTRVPA